MENKQGLPEELTKTLDPSELENISGGKIFHLTDNKIHKETPYVVIADEVTHDAVPAKTPPKHPPVIGYGVLKHRKALGWYKTAEEAIEKAKEFGCTDTDITEGSISDIMSYSMCRDE